jgi:hypothetical protein
MFLATAVLTPTSLPAQQPTRFEVGTSAGLTVSIPDDGGTEGSVNLPGAGSFGGLATLYATFFAGRSWMIEPQLFLAWNSAVDELTYSAMLQLGYLVRPGAKGSVHAAANGGVFKLGTSGDIFDLDSPAVGAAGGYRIVVRDALALRFEIGYRRWLDFDLNEMNAVARMLAG